MQIDSTLGTKSRQNGVQSAIIEASCYHKHVIQVHPAILQTVSLRDSVNRGTSPLALSLWTQAFEMHATIMRLAALPL